MPDYSYKKFFFRPRSSYSFGEDDTLVIETDAPGAHSRITCRLREYNPVCEKVVHTASPVFTVCFAVFALAAASAVSFAASENGHGALASLVSFPAFAFLGAVLYFLRRIREKDSCYRFVNFYLDRELLVPFDPRRPEEADAFILELKRRIAKVFAMPVDHSDNPDEVRRKILDLAEDRLLTGPEAEVLAGKAGVPLNEKRNIGFGSYE